jgi:hypothetical protein
MAIANAMLGELGQTLIVVAGLLGSTLACDSDEVTPMIVQILQEAGFPKDADYSYSFDAIRKTDVSSGALTCAAKLHLDNKTGSGHDKGDYDIIYRAELTEEGQVHVIVSKEVLSSIAAQRPLSGEEAYVQKMMEEFKAQKEAQ